MLSEKSVNFAGVAHPSAKVTRAYLMERKFMAAPGMEVPEPQRFFNLVARGKPRPWSTNVTQAFWRSFVEAVSAHDDDGAAVARFAQRYGDPLGKLTSDNKINTADWFIWLTEMAGIAAAWEPADAGGVSHISKDPARISNAEGLIRFRARDLATHFTVIPDPTGAADLALRANTLGAYMWASAVSELWRRASMSRCRTCTNWFELGRSGSLYCSSACRVAHSVANKKKG